MKTRVRQSGLTLIELMIAMLVGLFLLTGIVMVFINSNKSNHMQENLSRLQENARFAIEFLSRDLRMVGYWDCMAPAPSTPVYKDLFGVNGASNAPDSITVRAAFVRTRVPPLPALPPSCGTAVTAAATVACPQAAPPDNFYADNSSIITYSINNGNLRRVTNCTTNDVVEGVENLQILYGVDTDAKGTANYGTPNYYVAANALAETDWPNVKSLRVTITVSTQDGDLVTKTTANPNGQIKHDFTTTIALRNRMI